MGKASLPVFFDPAQRAHNPATELHNGSFVPYAEHVGRIDALAQTLTAAAYALHMPQDFGMAPIAAVHGAAYLDFLQHAHQRWREAGRGGDASGYAWPVVGRRPLRLNRIDGDLGQYSFDAATPIAEHSWASAYANAQTALAAMDAALSGAPISCGLCRPPGHHAGADYMGGYCYLNNVAIAAQHARDQGAGRIAILDVDYHHGNGTQDIFYTRDDVYFASLHADPVTDFPFYWGHADERGEGAGQGFNANYPLPRGMAWPEYARVLDKALAGISDFQPDMLLISFGADTLDSDPISHLSLTVDDYPLMGSAIAALKLPSVIIMEGGYDTAAIGPALTGFLSGWR